MYYQRNVTGKLQEALSDTPVVLLNGARQTGKSTLVQYLAENLHPARYLTFDDYGILAAAKEDPSGFLGGYDEPLILDEVQKIPELFPALKVEVDRKRREGRFLLTGSADIMLLPKLSESLAGRMEIHTLWPLSQGEIRGSKETFLDSVWSDSFAPSALTSEDRGELIDRMVAGGYPEALTRKKEHRRKAWFESYLTTLIQRDVRDLSNIEDITRLPRLLSLLAARTTSLIDYAEISRSSAIPQTTLKRYVALLETAFLIRYLPAWSGNIDKRLIKAPKIIINDIGLLVYLLGYSKDRFLASSQDLGPVLETFVVTELLKQMTWSRIRARAFHFRSAGGSEVDILLEDERGQCVGIEVKAGATVRGADFRGLRFLAQILGPAFLRGIVLYLGRESIPFGTNLMALPLSALWSIQA